jgi:glycosyltransferase involved in cell wall biosynthesis
MDGFTILKYCLDSLFRTVHPKTFITIANNGSADEVRSYLEKLYNNGQIHELISTSNCGKINAVLKGMSGHNFPLVTVSDADVLFLPGWQSATYEVFKHFPKAGAVCPTPSSRSYKTYTSNIWFDLFFSKSLQFTPVKDPESLLDFANSINYKTLYNQYHLSSYLTVSNQNVKAVVGAGHFVATYRSEVFKDIPKYSNFKLGGDSEETVLDVPVFKNGYWRLSTHSNYAKHMGNVVEPWMQNELIDEGVFTEIAPSDWVWPENKSRNYGVVKIFSKIISKPFFLRWFLRYKGLSAEASKKY